VRRKPRPFLIQELLVRSSHAVSSNDWRSFFCGVILNREIPISITGDSAFDHAAHFVVALDTESPRIADNSFKRSRVQEMDFASGSKWTGLGARNESARSCSGYACRAGSAKRQWLARCESNLFWFVAGWIPVLGLCWQVCRRYSPLAEEPSSPVQIPCRPDVCHVGRAECSLPGCCFYHGGPECPRHRVLGIFLGRSKLCSTTLSRVAICSKEASGVDVANALPF